VALPQATMFQRSAYDPEDRPAVAVDAEIAPAERRRRAA
jgi:hypothetical protein